MEELQIMPRKRLQLLGTQVKGLNVISFVGKQGKSHEMHYLTECPQCGDIQTYRGSYLLRNLKGCFRCYSSTGKWHSPEPVTITPMLAKGLCKCGQKAVERIIKKSVKGMPAKVHDLCRECFIAW